MIDHEAIRVRFKALDPLLDERGRRRYAAAEALAAGRGGISVVAEITGVARSTCGSVNGRSPESHRHLEELHCFVNCRVGQDRAPRRG